jgi:hypothetical protein
VNLPQRHAGCLRKFPSSRFLLQIPRTRALRNRQTESGVLMLALFHTRDPDPTQDVERHRRNDDRVMPSQSTLEVCGFVPETDKMTTVMPALDTVWCPPTGLSCGGLYYNRSRGILLTRCMGFNIVRQHGGLQGQILTLGLSRDNIRVARGREWPSSPNIST